jgi:hypothetical protein
MLRWSVPDATRDPKTGELVHDDLALSAALCAVLDEQDWPTLMSFSPHAWEWTGKLAVKYY